MSTLRTLLVIPSIRTITAQYLAPLVPHVDLLVVDDADGAVKATLPSGEVVPLRAAVSLGYLPQKTTQWAREDIVEWCQRRGWEELLSLIPEKNPSCKNFGLLYAWVHNYEQVILLDDDCDASITPSYMDQIPVGRKPPAVTAVTASGWVNPMALLSDADGLCSRGYPYAYRGEHQSLVQESVHYSHVVALNEGLWAGTPDINGVDKVQGQRLGRPDVTQDRQLTTTLVRVPHRAPLPLSIMNVQLLTSIVPYFWQPPDFRLPQGWRIRRHDDVWASLLLGAVGPSHWVRTMGAPLIYHRKAGDPVAELLSEHSTNFAQEWLERVLDSAHGETPEERLASVGAAASALADKRRGNMHVQAVQSYVQGALRWAEALTRIPRGAAVT